MKEIKLIEEREFSLAPYYGGGDEFTTYRLNVPLMEVIEQLGVTECSELYERLQSIGAKTPFAILASEQDVADLKMIEKQRSEIGISEEQDSEQERLYIINNCLLSLDYRDFPFEENGKWGLRCSTGKVVVPPMFDECKGSESICMADTMAAVKFNGKWWLTRRDNSGELATESYDYILRSYGYAWVYRDTKVGLLDAKTCETLIPCEQDWLRTPTFGLWYIGKGDKIGFFEPDNTCTGMYEPPTYIPATFDAIDVATGKICKNGRWGWLLRDGSFTENKRKIGNKFYVEPNLPLDTNERELYFGVQTQKLNILPGVILHRKRKKAKGQLPWIELDDVKVDIDSNVASQFKDLLPEKPHHIVVERPYGEPMNVNVEPDGAGKWNVTIEWIDRDEYDIAYDCNFPLIKACRKIIFSDKGSFAVCFKLNLEGCDFELPMKIISAFNLFRIRMPEVFTSLAK